MIPRDAKQSALRLALGFPILAITGPRQSGKTTLARSVFPDRAYVSLEDPDQREQAQADPRGFVARFPDGVVIDEVQRVPDLVSCLQGLVDGRRRMGDFILTGCPDRPTAQPVGAGQRRSLPRYGPRVAQRPGGELPDPGAATLPPQLRQAAG